MEIAIVSELEMAISSPLKWPFSLVMLVCQRVVMVPVPLETGPDNGMSRTCEIHTQLGWLLLVQDIDVLFLDENRSQLGDAWVTR